MRPGVRWQSYKTQLWSESNEISHTTLNQNSFCLHNFFRSIWTYLSAYPSTSTSVQPSVKIIMDLYFPNPLYNEIINIKRRFYLGRASFPFIWDFIILLLFGRQNNVVQPSPDSKSFYYIGQVPDVVLFMFLYFWHWSYERHLRPNLPFQWYRIPGFVSTCPSLLKWITWPSRYFYQIKLCNPSEWL